MKVFDFQEGDGPLLISVPHDGRDLPDDIDARMTPAGRELPDTDWHVAKLYDFAEDLGASILSARYSRYVVDLNRPVDDTALYAGQVSTGICPAKTFSGDALYIDAAEVTAEERRIRVARYWRPYHERIAQSLDALRDRFGYALLWDAHSIASRVPGLFDGELPVLNIGTNKGMSCPPELEIAVAKVAASSEYTAVCNGRFTGGYITRRYGKPQERQYALQLELAQRSYMDEKTLRYDKRRSAALRQVLREMLTATLKTAKALHA